uniref:Cadherin domain-containing protein n=1 Tax=Ditylenchus dipsaci TaxID=166011 RepID=A0A915DJE8_9BILA
MNFGYLNVEFYLSSVLLVSLVSQVLPLTVEPNVLFVEENWPLQKPLEVEICGDSFKQVRIVLGNDQGVFGLVPLTAKCGTLKLGGKHLDADTIDPEGKKGQFFSLVFEEKNKLQRSTLDVQVVDVNDNPPEFLNLPAEIELSPQQSVVGSVVYTVEVKDPDTGIGGVSRFAISGTDKFAIVNEKCSNSRCSAQLELKKPFEANKVEVLEISARDGASITKSSNEKRALLKITGVPGLQHHGYQKPNAPIFMSVFEGPLHISQNLRLSSKIVKVEAKSVVERNKNIIFYELGKPSAYFDVEKNTGLFS